jgi:hypothetical protein
MSGLTFDKVEDMAVKIANSVFGDISVKEDVRDIITDMVAFACATYVRDEDFKKDIDAYNNYRSLQNK